MFAKIILILNLDPDKDQDKIWDGPISVSGLYIIVYIFAKFHALFTKWTICLLNYPNMES